MVDKPVKLTSKSKVDKYYEIHFIDRDRGIAEITTLYREYSWTSKDGKTRTRRVILIPPTIAETLNLKDNDFVRIRIEKVGKKR